MLEILEYQIKEVQMAQIDCDREVVQVMCIIGITVMGCVAMFVDGEIGNTIAVAVAGVLGLAAGYLFKDRVEVKPA